MQFFGNRAKSPDFARDSRYVRMPYTAHRALNPPGVLAMSYEGETGC